MSKSGHQLIEFGSGLDFNHVDPSTKSPFTLGEIVVVCQEKNSLISARSLVANNYKCPFCLSQLNTDLTISETAGKVLDGPQKNSEEKQQVRRPHRGYWPLVGWGILSFFMIFLLALAVAGVYANLKFGPEKTPTETRVFQMSPTATLRSTATPRPTFTPQPTATKIPPTSTPAPIGVSVRNEKYEVTVLNARELKRVYMGNYYWYPNPGFLAIELEVQVKNLQPSVTVRVPWSNVNLIENNGDVWFPEWGGFLISESEKETIASGVSVNDLKDGKELVVFKDFTYLRLIRFFAENDPTVILFRFDNAPLIKVVIE